MIRNSSLAKRCLNSDAHTPAPEDLVARVEWMQEMSRTHTQRQCPACELWAIWEPKTATEAAEHG